jgi:hypothetical protein
MTDEFAQGGYRFEDLNPHAVSNRTDLPGSSELGFPLPIKTPASRMVSAIGSACLAEAARRYATP